VGGGWLGLVLLLVNLGLDVMFWGGFDEVVVLFAGSTQLAAIPTKRSVGEENCFI